MSEKIVWEPYTKNRCMTEPRATTPVGIVVHSTAVKGTKHTRWGQGSPWDTETSSKAAHALIDTDGIWQTLPWDVRCWLAAGDANYTHINLKSANRLRIQMKMLKSCMRTHCIFALTCAGSTRFLRMLSCAMRRLIKWALRTTIPTWRTGGERRELHGSRIRWTGSAPILRKLLENRKERLECTRGLCRRSMTGRLTCGLTRKRARVLQRSKMGRL